MSIVSWKKEYYPVPAEESDISAAIEHSLRKWKGLRPEALKEHQVTCESGLLRSCDFATTSHQTRPYFPIDAESCSLCVHYYCDGTTTCGYCPLYATLGDRCDEESTSPYMVFLKTRDPEPMIKALEDTLERFSNKGKDDE